MTLGINTAEIGLTNGTAVTTANSGGGVGNTAFTVLTNTTGAVTVDNTAPHGGTYSFLFNSPASTDFVRGTITVSTSHLCFEAYYKWAGFVASGEDRIISPISASTSTYVQATSAGKFRVYDNSGSTALWTSANTLSTGTWYRISYGIDVGTTTANGTTRFSYYSGANLETNTADETFLLTTSNTGTVPMTGIRFGHSTTGIRPAMRIDDLQYSDTSSAVIGAPGGTTPINSWTTTNTVIIDASATSGSPTSQTLVQQSGPTVTVTGPVSGVFTVTLPTPLASAAVVRLTSVNGALSDIDDITINPVGGTVTNVIRDPRIQTASGLV